MKDILRKIFEANPEKSTIIINGKCSDCGCAMVVEIVPTSGGYGLRGGILAKCSPEKYSITCSECYKFNSKIKAPHRSKSAHA
jgi:hypothetical protein